MPLQTLLEEITFTPSSVMPGRESITVLVPCWPNFSCKQKEYRGCVPDRNGEPWSYSALILWAFGPQGFGHVDAALHLMRDDLPYNWLVDYSVWEYCKRRCTKHRSLIWTK